MRIVEENLKEKDVIKKLSKRYNEKEKIICEMVKICKKNRYSIDETRKAIGEFEEKINGKYIKLEK